MGNCLVTKLNEAMSNSKLKPLYDLAIDCKYFTFDTYTEQIANGFSVNIQKQNTTDMTIEGDGYFMSRIAENLEELTDGTASIGKTADRTRYRSNGNYRIVVPNKKDITYFNVVGAYISPIDLMGITKLTYLGLSNNYFTEPLSVGNICRNNPNLSDIRLINYPYGYDLSEIINNAPNIQIIRTHSNAPYVVLPWNPANIQPRENLQITGDVKYLGNLLSLTQADVSSTGIHGDFYETVELFRTNGKTTGSFTSFQLNAIRNLFTFNGVTIHKHAINERSTISWDATHAALISPSKVYHVGYSASEIAEKQAGDWSGKTLIDCNA